MDEWMNGWVDDIPFDRDVKGGNSIPVFILFSILTKVNSSLCSGYNQDDVTDLRKPLIIVSTSGWDRRYFSLSILVLI